MKQFSFPPSCTGREKHQIEHEAGLALLRDGLLKEFGLDIPDMSAAVKTEEKGKPYLPSYPDIHFNISHSNSVAVCAIGKKALGIDVELVRPVKIPSFRRILTEGERQRMEECPKGEREREFFRIWTLKESYAKALGLGLGLDFTSVEFTIKPAGEHLWQAKVKRLSPLPDVREEDWKLIQTIKNVGEEEYVISFCELE